MPSRGEEDCFGARRTKDVVDDEITDAEKAALRRRESTPILRSPTASTDVPANRESLTTTTMEAWI